MNSNKISIIIPHYESWNLLNTLLLSIPQKNNFEVIVIDDHSNHNKRRIQKLKKQFPAFIFEINDHGKKGAGAARNKGLRLATGKWLLFADSDDVFTSHLSDKLEPYLNSSSDIIYFTPTSFNDETKRESSRHTQYEKYINNYLESNNHQDELKLRYNFLVPWSKLIKHSLIAENNIDFEEIMYSNDVLFSAKIDYHAKHIAASLNVIYAVRESSHSLTSVMDQTIFQQRFHAWLDYAIYLRNNLNKKDLDLLNVSTLPQFLHIWNNQLDWSNVKYVYKYSRKHRIPLIDKRVLRIRSFRNILAKYFKK